MQTLNHRMNGHYIWYIAFLKKSPFFKDLAALAVAQAMIFLIIHSFRDSYKLERKTQKVPLVSFFCIQAKRISWYSTNHEEIAHNPKRDIHCSKAWFHQAEDWIRLLVILFKVFPRHHWPSHGSFFGWYYCRVEHIAGWLLGFFSLELWLCNAMLDQ